MAAFKRTREADADIIGIVRYTKQQWGEAQARRYHYAIDAACQALARGEIAGKQVALGGKNLRMVRCQHHYIFYSPGDVPLIIRILHEKMDYMSRLQLLTK